MGGGYNILEPSAGCGNVVKAIRNLGLDNNITSLEIREEEFETLKSISDEVIIEDFIKWETKDKYDIIIGNPPYSLAKEFIEKCFDLVSDRGQVIMLLRTAFLESKSRYEFWQENPLSGLCVLSKRPSFTGKGTDATSYSWFVWDKSTDKQYIKVI